MVESITFSSENRERHFVEAKARMQRWLVMSSGSTGFKVDAGLTPFACMANSLDLFEHWASQLRPIKCSHDNLHSMLEERFRMAEELYEDLAVWFHGIDKG